MHLTNAEHLSVANLLRRNPHRKYQ